MPSVSQINVAITTDRPWVLHRSIIQPPITRIDLSAAGVRLFADLPRQMISSHDNHFTIFLFHLLLLFFAGAPRVRSIGISADLYNSVMIIDSDDERRDRRCMILHWRRITIASTEWKFADITCKSHAINNYPFAFAIESNFRTKLKQMKREIQRRIKFVEWFITHVGPDITWNFVIRILKLIKAAFQICHGHA